MPGHTAQGSVEPRGRLDTYNGGTATLQVVSFDGLVPNAANHVATSFIINREPFSGTGFGFNIHGLLSTEHGYSGSNGLVEAILRRCIDRTIAQNFVEAARHR